MTFIELYALFLKGGILMWPILFSSLIGTTIFFERLLRYRKVSKRIKASANETIIRLIHDAKISQAATLIQEKLDHFNAPGRIMRDALHIEDPDRETMELVLVHAVEREMSQLTQYLSTLGLLASMAPMLGLLGTVTGMIEAFSVVETMGGGVNAAMLAGGIWEAMLTTAIGLIVAIPLLFFHNHLEGRLEVIRQNLEDIAIAFVKAWTHSRTLV